MRVTQVMTEFVFPDMRRAWHSFYPDPISRHRSDRTAATGHRHKQVMIRGGINVLGNSGLARCFKTT